MDRAFQRSRSLMLRGTFYSVPPKYKAKTTAKQTNNCQTVTKCDILINN